jgi:enoyl-CoA hydratase/carnithine racemase
MTYPVYECLGVELHSHGVAVVTLNRPAKRNAFSQRMIDELVLMLSVIDRDSRVRAVVLTGSPGGPFCGRYTEVRREVKLTAFVAGMDLNELVQISTNEAHDRRFLQDLTDAFANFRKPIIAAVVGLAVCLLGCSCAFRLTTPAWRRLRDCVGCEFEPRPWQALEWSDDTCSAT